MGICHGGPGQRPAGLMARLCSGSIALSLGARPEARRGPGASWGAPALVDKSTSAPDWSPARERFPQV